VEAYRERGSAPVMSAPVMSAPKKAPKEPPPGVLAVSRVAPAAPQVSAPAPAQASAPAPVQTSAPAPAQAPIGPPRQTVRFGSRGREVSDLQAMLGIGVDGIFGPKTDQAVRAYQRTHGLKADGVVGPLTWASLERGA
jgi:peptidoglycan hydrolase-like protein with peptidoglycan-binding domain